MYPGNQTESEILSVPRNLKTRPGAPETHLAYITDDEAELLKEYKPGTPHEGAAGIPNYDTWGIDTTTGTVTGGSTADGGGAWSGDVGGTQDEPAPQYSTDQYGIQDTQDLISADLWENQPTDFSTASTPGMTTGFGSWFGANTASTGSSELVQTTIKNEIEKQIQALKDKKGTNIISTQENNDIVKGVFNNFYPKIAQYTLEQFIAQNNPQTQEELDSLIADYNASQASMIPGYANLMKYEGYSAGEYPEIFESYYQPPSGGGGGGGWGSRGGGGRGGRGGGGGGGGGMPKYGGDFAGEDPWGRSRIQEAWIEQLRGMNRGGIVSLC